MSNPSRFDKVALLTANGGNMFNNYCLRPEYNQMQCDVRLADDPAPLLDGTKCLLLLGEKAMHKYCPDTAGNTLNEMRGSLLNHNGIPCIASYLPQDAADFKAYESELNPDAGDYSTDGDMVDDDENEGDVKALSPTRRSNYFFWLKRDVWKVKRIVSGELPISRIPSYKIFPSSDEIITTLQNNKNRFLYLDLETDYEEQNLLCFSFAFSEEMVYCVPVLDPDYKWAYSSVPHILRALSVAIRDNIAVAHNGAEFDFLVLGMKYGIAINKAYDTRVAMHRCFPDVETSLGHCTSYWTWERFHKDTDSRAYMTREHMMQKLQYCGKDVYTMVLIHKEIEKYAKTIPGLQESIKCAMDSIRPYLITTLLGIKYSQEKLQEVIAENDRWMTQYKRMINILVGEFGLEEIKKRLKGKKTSSLAGSSKQCVAYFHDLLGYPVIWRTPEGAPALGKKQLYRLALKHPDNPVIMLVNAYRALAKESGSLKFNPWKDDNGKRFPRIKINEEEEQQQLSMLGMLAKYT